MEILTWGVLSSLNYWAIIVVAIGSFFVGGLWYSPALFEESWISTNGFTDEQVRVIRLQVGVAEFLVTFLTNLFMAFVLGILSKVLAIGTVVDGVVLAVLLWIGFVASFSLAVNIFSTRSIKAWVIDASYHLVVLVIGGFVYATWH